MTTQTAPCELVEGAAMESGCPTCGHVVMSHRVDTHVCALCEAIDRAVAAATPAEAEEHPELGPPPPNFGPDDAPPWPPMWAGTDPLDDDDNPEPGRRVPFQAAAATPEWISIYWHCSVALPQSVPITMDGVPWLARVASCEHLPAHPGALTSTPDIQVVLELVEEAP